jgi:hypothetical protein
MNNMEPSAQGLKKLFFPRFPPKWFLWQTDSCGWLDGPSQRGVRRRAKLLVTESEQLEQALSEWMLWMRYESNLERNGIRAPKRDRLLRPRRNSKNVRG